VARNYRQLIARHRDFSLFFLKMKGHRKIGGLFIFAGARLGIIRAY
jgi:hypothetical protein